MRPCERRSRFADARFRARLVVILRPLVEEHRRRVLADWQERYLEGHGLGGELVGIGRALVDDPLAHRRLPPSPALSPLDDVRARARAERVSDEWRRDLRVAAMVPPDPRRFALVVSV